MNKLQLAWRMLRRDARAGELRLLLGALIVAVAALTAVGFFTDRVSRALAREAHQLLGADLLFTADHPWSPEVKASALMSGLTVAETQTFPSMVSHGEGAQLADIKAVSGGYPLRGTLRISAGLNAPDQATREIPVAGTVWIDERLATSLSVAVGDAVQVGDSRLRVAAILMLEPDRGINFFSLAPRLLMNLDDLAKTNLVQQGSRVVYRLLFAGADQRVDAFAAEYKPKLSRGEHIEDAQNGRPELRMALDRAQKFLGLSALLTVVLAAVAVALATRRYVQRHLDACAVMRCLGARQNELLTVFILQFLLLALIGAVVGCALGFAGHFVLHALLSQLVATPLPAPSLLPAVQGMLLGLLLFGFAIPPLLQLGSVPTLRVLRRELGAPGRGLLIGYVIGALVLAGLMLWIAGEIKLGLYVTGGFAAALLIFGAIARGAIRLLARFRQRGGFGTRYAFAGLERHSAASVVQIVALALGFMAILLLTVTRGELLDAWQRTTPPDAPNRFVINIQPDQLAAVEHAFAEAGLKAALVPMVRGRLVRVNGKEVSAANYTEERAQRLVDREFNLSWRADLPQGNRLTAGAWFTPGSRDEASVEDGLAKTLGLKLGDQLEFDLAGSPVLVRISSLRKLDWDSMRVNFFVLTPPGVIDQYPQSLITSFHLPAGQEAFVSQLVHRFPNLTVIDVGAILRQLQWVMTQVARAVQFVFLFTLLAGVMVLYAALANVLDERRQELAVMRALGAQEHQLKRALQGEFAVIGGIAGLIAALGCVLVGQVLARQVFQFDLSPAWWLPPLAGLCGAIVVPLAAAQATKRLLSAPPLAALRAA